jgi:hypothetical protein
MNVRWFLVLMFLISRKGALVEWCSIPILAVVGQRAVIDTELARGLEAYELLAGTRASVVSPTKAAAFLSKKGIKDKAVGAFAWVREN